MADQKRDSQIISAIHQIVQRLLTTAAPPGETQDGKKDPASEVLFRSGRNIAHLEVATNGQLISVPESNVLHCKVCVIEFESDLHAADGCKATGVFKYDFSLGSVFNNLDYLPQQFI